MFPYIITTKREEILSTEKPVTEKKPDYIVIITVVILKISKENPKDYVEVKSTHNEKVIYLKKVNKFHENFGKFFENLEDAEKALQEIFQSKPFKF